MTIPPELAGATLTIDLAALVGNWRKIAETVSPAECAATVKADGYGCGAREVAQALWQAGCRTFFVALPLEGKQVRDALPEAIIYVLDGLLAGQAEFYITHDLRPCLMDPAELTEWANATEGRHKAAVHIDTGINRLGLDREQAEALAADAALIKRAGLCLLMSHLASGDDEANPSNASQRDRFTSLRTLFPSLPASLANAPGTFLGPEFFHDVVRPGVALYGGTPLGTRPSPMQPVVSLSAPILQVRDVAAGDGVGYGATWRAEKPSRIAIVGVGYADGLLRAMSWPAQQDGPAKVFIEGQMAPIVGRVSMDMITIDVTDLEPNRVCRGTSAELLGANITVDDWASWSGTIGYEILTSLGRRYAKVYSS